MIKKLFLLLWARAYEQNKLNILSLCEKNPKAFFLDLGCDDGAWSMEVAKRIGTSHIYGIDYITEQLKKAKARGLEVKKGDLNKKLPYKDNHFDVVHSNQVIEHLFEIDTYVSEIYRIVKPGGYAIISTENLASWHNIFSLVMGWQAFSQHISKRYHIGNPLSPHFNEAQREGWTHLLIFTFYSLQELFKQYGFTIEKAVGAGYHPLPVKVANLDPWHSHFITIKVRKPLKRR